MFSTVVGLRMGVFARARSRESNELRNELYDFLVILVLHDEKGEGGLSVSKIVRSIQDELSIETIPFDFIKQSIERLLKKEVIKIDNISNRYILSDEYKTKYDELHKRYNGVINNVHESFKKQITEKISQLKEDDFDKIIHVLDDLLAKIFSLMSLEACTNIIELSEKKSFIDVDVYSILKDMLKGVPYKNTVKDIIVDYIQNPDDDLREYLYSLAQGYFCIGILQLDPECNKYTKESLSEKIVYLDTNIIYHSLVRTDKRSSATNYALEKSREIGVNLVISRRTKLEYDTMLRHRKYGLKKIDNIPSERYDKISNKLGKGLVTDYFESKKIRPRLSIDSYFTRLESYQTILGNLYDVKYDDDKHENIYDLETFEKAKQCVLRASDRYSMLKTNNTAIHDAFHILLIKELRYESEGDALGPNYWFLTNDGSLDFAEKCMESDLKSSLMSSNWIQIISPFLSPSHDKSSSEAFVSLFSSRLPMASDLIDENDFLMLQGDWIDDEGLSPEDIAIIMGNRHIKRYLRKVKEEDTPITPEDLSKALAPIIEVIKNTRKLSIDTREILGEQERKIVEQETRIGEQDSKIGEQETRIGEQDSKIGEQETRIGEQDSKIGEQDETIDGLSEKTHALEADVSALRNTLKRMSYVIGTIIWLVVFISSYLYLFVEENNKFWFSIILATLIGYSLGFPVYRKLLDIVLSKREVLE